MLSRGTRRPLPKLGDQADGPWELRPTGPMPMRQILEEEGYPSENVYTVAGKAGTEPLLPEDPSLAPNRRITITLMSEAPPVPVDLKP